MPSICLAFCWPHLYRISDIFISQVAPLYCSDGFPLSFLLAFELNFPYTTHHHFFSRQKTGTDLAELTIHFLTQFHLSWACLFLAQYLMNSSKIFSTKSAMTPLTAWTKMALGRRFLWQYGHAQRRLMMKWVRFPPLLIYKNGAFQDSKQFWVDFTGKLTLKQLGCTSLVFQTVTFFISIRWRQKLKYNIT